MRIKRVALPLVMTACAPSKGPTVMGPHGEVAWADVVHTDLEHYVGGPIVVFDVDHGTLATLCGEPAVAAVRGWQQRFVKDGALCTGGDDSPWRLVCYANGFDHVYVTFEDEQAPRITRVIIGDPPGSTGMQKMMNRIDEETKSASCH